MQKRILFLLAAFFVFFVSSTAYALNLYADSISTDSQITGTGWWGGTPYDPTSVTWEITDMGGYYHYKYTFDHPEHDASHFIIEVSDSFTSSDITTSLIYEIDTTKYRNGNTTIAVLAYDQVGNQYLASIYVNIQNEGKSLLWVYIISGIAVALITAILVIYFQVIKPSRRRKELATEMLSEEEKQKILEEQKQRELEEIRLREEAEMATPESEALKPFIYECKRCSKQFKNKEYIWSMMCPDCNTDTLTLVYQCKLCGRIYNYDMPGEYFCTNCDIKLLK